MSRPEQKACSILLNTRVKVYELMQKKGSTPELYYDESLAELLFDCSNALALLGYELIPK